MGEYGFMMKQVALLVEAYHLASCTEAWVDAHHALLSQRRGKQKLAQILCKYGYGIAVGILLAQGGKLRFY